MISEFCCRPYSLDHFDDYEKHFTVMNYVEEGTRLKQVHYDDFIPMFESQYPAYKWAEVEVSSKKSFHNTFHISLFTNFNCISTNMCITRRKPVDITLS